MASDEEKKGHQVSMEMLQKRQKVFERVVLIFIIGFSLILTLLFFDLHTRKARQKAMISTEVQKLQSDLNNLKLRLDRLEDKRTVDESLENVMRRHRRSFEKTKTSDLIYRTIDFLFNKRIPDGCLQNASIVCLPGKDGSPGPIGPRGLNGITGAPGWPGERGAQGSKGEPGEKGQMGATGPIGPRGENGATGPVGPVGHKGAKGGPGMNGLPGIRGMKGTRGDQGATGVKGDIGPVGAKGETGAIGPVGPKGEKGDRGLSGPVFQKPVITIAPNSATVRRSATAKFACRASGYPKPEIRWYLNGESIARNNTRLIDEMSMLILTDISERDAGILKCVASSVLGKSEAITQLFVLMAPQIQLNPEIPRYLTVEYGSDVEVICNGTGYPEPEITWQKVNSMSTTTTKTSTGNRTGRLILKSVNETDSGLYRCHARNSAGHAERSMLLFVKDPFKDCRHLFEEGFTKNGTYIIKPDNLEPFRVFCDMETSPGGWVVFQRRVSASTNFNRGWLAYKNGFGELDENFWLGLDKIHRLTTVSSTLRVDLTMTRSTYYNSRGYYSSRRSEVYAKYSRFFVGDERENYRLSVSRYNGQYAGDSLSYHNGMPFSTYDRDNDMHGSINCAADQGGAWWHKACQYSALNAKFPTAFSPNSNKYMTWYTRNNRFGDAKYSEMKLRRN